MILSINGQINRVYTLLLSLVGLSVFFNGCSPAPAPNSLGLSSPSSTTTIVLTSCGAPVTPTLTASYQVSGNANVAPTSVSYSISSGALNGLKFNPDGSISGILSGQYTINATYYGTSTSISVSVSPGAPAFLDLVSGQNQTTVAGQNATNPIGFVVKDCNLNPIAKSAVSFSSDKGVVSPSSSFSNENGLVYVTYTASTTTGKYVIAATSNSITTDSTQTVISDSPRNLVFSKQPSVAAIAGLAFSTQPTVSATDQYGNPALAIGTVSVQAYSDPLCTSPASLIGDLGLTSFVNGFASFSGTAYNRAEIIYLRATMLSMSSICSSIITVSPASASVLTKISGDNQNGVVNTTLVNPLSFKISDAYGNTVPNQPALISFSDGSNTVSLSSNNQGIVSFSYRLPKSIGTKSISSSINGSSVSFSAIAVADALSSFSKVNGDSQTGVVNTILSQQLSVLARDQYGNQISGIPVRFSGLGTFSNITGITDQNGQFTITYTAPTIVGQYTLIATAMGVLTVSFQESTISGPGYLVQKVSGDVQSAVAATSLTLPLSVLVKDQFGNTVSGVPVSFSKSGQEGGSFSQTTVTTNSSGSASSVFTVGPITGTYSITTAANTFGSPNSVNFSYQVLAGTPTVLTYISGTNQIAPANSILPVAFTVEIRDIYNNLVPNQNILYSVTSSQSGAFLTPAVSPSNSSGQASSFLSFGPQAGAYTVLAQVQSNQSLSTQFSATATPLNPSALTSTIVGSSPTVSDGAATSTISIYLKDQLLNPVYGVVPSVSIGGSNNTVSACSITNNLGLSTCAVSSTMSESKMIELISPVNISGTPIQFIPGPASSLLSNISATSSIIADNTMQSLVTIKLIDAYSNPVSGVIPTFTVTGSGNTLAPCSASNLTGSSSCSFTSTVAESKTISLSSPISLPGNAVYFLPGPGIAASSSIVGGTDTTADGVSVGIISITISDQFNNPVPNQSITFAAAGSNNTLGACTLTNSSGQSSCSMTSTRAEVKNLSIKTPVLKPGGTIKFVAGQSVASNSSVIGSSDSGGQSWAVDDTIGIPLAHVYLFDLFNNPVIGVIPSFSATGAGNMIGQCAPTNIFGQAACPIHSSVAESKMLSITSPVSLIGGAILFRAGQPNKANSTVTYNTPVLADLSVESTINVTLLDLYSNPVPNITLSLTTTIPNGSFLIRPCSISSSIGKLNCGISSSLAGQFSSNFTNYNISNPIVTTFTSGPASSLTTTITATSPVIADNFDTSSVSIRLADKNNNPINNQIPTITVSGSSNAIQQCSSLDLNGNYSCLFSSSVGETKTVMITSPTGLSSLSSSVVFQTINSPTISAAKANINSTSTTINVSNCNSASSVLFSESGTQPSLTDPNWSSCGVGTYNFITSFGDGTKTIYGWGKLGHGVALTPSITTLILDTLTPVVSITTPSVDGQSFSSISITFSGTCESPLNVIPSYSANLSGLGSVPCVGGSFSLSATVSPESSGSTESLTIYQTDLAGNIGSATRSVSIVPVWPFGLMGNLTIASGQTVTLNPGTNYDYNNVQIDSGGLLLLGGGGEVIILGIRGSLTLNGTISGSAQTHVDGSWSATAPDGNTLSYSISQASGGGAQAFGNGAGGASPNGPGSPPTFSSGGTGGNGNPNNFGNGAGGSGGGVPDGGGGRGTDMNYNGSGFGGDLSAGGGGGGGRGSHGQGLYLKVAGITSGTGTINLNGTGGGSGGAAGAPGSNSSIRGPGSNGGSGGAGGSGGKLIWMYHGAVPTISVDTSAGPGGSAGAGFTNSSAPGSNGTAGTRGSSGSALRQAY